MGDIILAFGEDEIRSVGRLQRVVVDAPANESVKIRVLRGTDELTLSASLPSQGEIEGFDILIPPELRDRLQRQLQRGELTRAEVEEIVRRYEERRDSVIAGTVESVDPGIVGGFILTLRRYVGGESVSIELNDETEIRRGLEALQPADLGDGEIVPVPSMDNGRTAFSVHRLRDTARVARRWPAYSGWRRSHHWKASDRASQEASTTSVLAPTVCQE